MRDTPSAQTLLDWYDANARVLPWRISPEDRRAGEIPDPYSVWLSEVMLQQTTVAAVKSYFLKFIGLWPTVGQLAGAEDSSVMAEWAGLGYYARARNLLNCARVVTSDHDGRFPETREELLKLPGIGPYTASAIAAIAFDRRATVVDGNVERVMARVFSVETPLPAAKPELTALADGLTPQQRPGDYAQAVMDLGATICTPRTPACGICPWMRTCRGKKLGIAADLPKKSPKKGKPTRFGIAYVAQREDGAWLLETRPNKGLLGGMLGWPGTEWSEERPKDVPPLEAEWLNSESEVHHAFTHFDLRLSLRLARVPVSTRPARGEFVARHAFRPSDLPTVMRKVYDLASRDGHLIEETIDAGL